MTLQEQLDDIRNRLKAEGLPEPVNTRSGCKVGWESYAEEAHAQIRAKYAREEAEVIAQMGYDFGYQVPGSIKRWGPWWEVCIP